MTAQPQQQDLKTYPIDLDVQPGLSDSKKHALFKSITQHIKSDNAPVIQFVSALKNEGAGHVAFETAMSAAHDFQKNIVFVDASFETSGFLQKLNQHIQHTVFHGHTHEPSSQIPIYSQENSSFSFCKLFKNNSANFSDQSLAVVFETLKTHFDMIFIYTESALSDETSASFTNVTDGTLLVVEAERTRSPVVKALKNKIESSGGVIIGTVLNRRRFHIPQLIHRLFFKT